MKLANTISLQRLAHLLRIEFATSDRRIWYGIGGVTLLLLIVFIVDAVDSHEQVYTLHVTMLPFWFLLGGTIFTGSIFYQFRETSTRAYYLTLPASTFEKFVSKWLISGPGWILGFLFLYWLVSSLVYGIAGSFTGIDHLSVFQKPHALQIFVIIYLSLHGVFLTGAIYFNRLSYLKTNITVFLISALFVGIGFILFRLIMAPHLNGWEAAGPRELTPGYGRWLERLKDLVFFVGAGIILPLFYWMVAFFKLKEKEVK